VLVANSNLQMRLILKPLKAQLKRLDSTACDLIVALSSDIWMLLCM
jgi:hypothetical protein